MKGSIAALLLCSGMVQAGMAQAANVSVQVGRTPELTFSRQVSSVATLATPWGTQTAAFSGAALYAGDPQHYWSGLNPLKLQVKVPPGTAAGAYPVSVVTTLYVCDQKIHLCSVRPAQAQGELTVGPQAKPLTLTLEVPGLRRF